VNEALAPVQSWEYKVQGSKFLLSTHPPINLFSTPPLSSSQLLTFSSYQLLNYLRYSISTVIRDSKVSVPSLIIDRPLPKDRLKIKKDQPNNSIAHQPKCQIDRINYFWASALMKLSQREKNILKFALKLTVSAVGLWVVVDKIDYDQAKTILVKTNPL